ncbi:HPF/RaiA family ribosome-associated protein [Legionella waltersii]|uniref:Sigma 54 modulation protein YhbH n=1 Tax=Legionella waltersii TaxID=66969 RepID=A0A0W1ABE8_9GAMM|nr:HPF/RaiA family ribosome-associated protein [Legionella waltersii]KTD78480.1 sigma 54 modulation protein YhbH [Legionella waltersii]SNV05841.1 sigma 54 modulation protein YhbH [Legionella waltersii]
MSTVQTTIRGITSTPAINYHIDRHLKKLKRAYRKINKCKVIVDLAKNNTHKDKLYSVCIDITIPGKELVSKKQDPNLFIAIRNSFFALEQLLAKHHKKKVLGSKNQAHYLRYYNKDTMAEAV